MKKSAKKKIPFNSKQYTSKKNYYFLILIVILLTALFSFLFVFKYTGKAINQQNEQTNNVGVISWFLEKFFKSNPSRLNNTCVENWKCYQWSICSNNQQSRTCNDLNRCGTTKNKPATVQSCSVNCVENWKCTDWSACYNNNQRRTCEDLNRCGTTKNLPPLNQSCSCTEKWSCTNWSSCSINNQQSRNCNDLNKCGTTKNKPTTTQSCSKPCTERWSCTNWGSCSNNQQSRNCNDLNRCGTTKNKPTTTQSCSCTEKWSCTNWGSCSNNQQSRNCNDLNKCGTTKNKPATTQSCSCTEKWSCNDWLKCIDNVQIRTCHDLNRCGTTNNKPKTSQYCPVSCVEDWRCYGWGTCLSIAGKPEKRHRTCIDVNQCGSRKNIPITEELCNPVCKENWKCDYICNNGVMTSSCKDLNNCGTTNNKPSEVTQNCDGLAAYYTLNKLVDIDNSDKSGKIVSEIFEFNSNLKGINFISSENNGNKILTINSNVSLDSPVIPFESGKFSLSFWFKPSQYRNLIISSLEIYNSKNVYLGNYNLLLDDNYLGLTSTKNNDIRNRIGTNTIKTYYGGNPFYGGSFESGISSVLLDSWNFYTIVFEGENCKIYINGKKLETTSPLSSSKSDNCKSMLLISPGEIGNAKFVIKGIPKSYGGILQESGKIDEIKLYTKSLSESEIKQNLFAENNFIGKKFSEDYLKINLGMQCPDIKSAIQKGVISDPIYKKCLTEKCDFCVGSLENCQFGSSCSSARGCMLCST